MTLDIQRSGYDNLFLVAGYDWYSKLQLTQGPDYQAWDKEAQRLAANFDKLDKTDPVLVAKWENEVLHACGMKGKPLPKPVVPAPKPAPAAAAKPAAKVAAPPAVDPAFAAILVPNDKQPQPPIAVSPPKEAQ